MTFGEIFRGSHGAPPRCFSMLFEAWGGIYTHGLSHGLNSITQKLGWDPIFPGTNLETEFWTLGASRPA
jgi:hypothetical protein